MATATQTNTIEGQDKSENWIAKSESIAAVKKNKEKARSVSRVDMTTNKASNVQFWTANAVSASKKDTFLNHVLALKTTRTR